MREEDYIIERGVIGGRVVAMGDGTLKERQEKETR